MALGIDRAIHLVTDGEEWDPQATAGAIVEAIEAERAARRRLRPDLLRQRVGGLGRLPGRDPSRARSGTPGRDRAQGRGGRGRTRPLRAGGAGGRDVFDLPLPAVVTVKEGLNFPRYPSVPGGCGRRRSRSQRAPRPPARPRLEKARLVVPPGERKEAEILGHGPEAAPARRRGAAADRGRVTRPRPRRA